MPIDIPATPAVAHYALAQKRFMSVLDFEVLLDKGITTDQLTQYRHTRISSMEDFPDYVNFLRALGAVRFQSGRFVRA